MSSIANCHNHSISAPLTESDNDDENEFDSSVNRQNESMMHKVKEVVSKFLHPSFLFSNNNDTNSPKRKRSTSVEEQQTVTTTTNTTNAHTTRSRSKYDRSSIRDEEPQISDDEDSNGRDVLSTEQDLTEIEQQTKRRRTANYQHILSTKTTNGHHNDERTSSPITSTDNVRSLSNLRINHTPNTTSKQRFNILPTYRGSTSTYDPSKSPLFSAGNRKPTETTTTTTNLKSNEFSANYLLASGLVSRPQPSSLNSQQSPATLTHPITTNTSHRLVNERQMFSVNYSSINSRRLPYIERLRRRTLEDCIRLNRTVDSEPLSASIIEEHKSTTASPAPKRTKVPDKECGIQCDISIEPNKKIQRTFSPVDFQNEGLSVPNTEKTDSSIQTNSSITIEKIQSPVPPIINITKPKVLGNITPFSWPKFARAQEEFAKKYPEKCRANDVPTKSVASSVIEKPNVNITPIIPQQTNTIAIPKMPIFPFSSSRPVESIWKCPSCTKEHPAQIASCSFCHGINPNYKKPSAIEPTKTIEQQPLLSNKLPDIIAKEPSVPTPNTTITNQIIPTTTKENVLSIPSAVTTSASSTTFPPFGITPITPVPVTTKENSTTITAPVTTTPLFGIVPVVSSITTTTTTKENLVTTTSSITPLFSTVPTVSPPTTTTTQENPVSTSASRPLFGITPFVSPIITTTKENSVTTSTSPMFGTTTFDKTSTASVNSPFQIGTTFQPFAPAPSTSLNTPITSSTVPSITTITPASSQALTSTSFGPFSGIPITTTTTTTVTPIVSTVSSDQSPGFTSIPNTSAPSITTNTATSSNLFSSSTITPTPAIATNTSSFPASSTISTLTIPNNFAFTSSAATPASSLFGSGGFNMPSASTTIVQSTTPFGFGAGSPLRPFAPAAVSSMNSTNTTSFGTNASFGTVAPFGITPASVDRPASSVSSFLPSGTSNTPSPFGFGSTSNTIQTSIAPVVSTSGFSFAPPSSTGPIFGAGPPSLSNTLNFGTPPTLPANNNLFQFSPTTSTSVSNPFSTPISSDSAIDPSNPFSIGSNDSTSSNKRPILKARRHRP